MRRMPRPRPLFPIHGAGTDALAVGGFLSGMAVRVTPDGLEDVTAPGMPQLNGVWVRPDGTATAVGVQGAVWSWDGASWRAAAVSRQGNRCPAGRPPPIDRHR